MYRLLAIMFALFLFTPCIKAEDQPKKFFLEDDGSVTLRMEKIESKIANLETRVAALEKSYLPPLAKPKATFTVPVPVPKAIPTTGQACAAGCNCNQASSTLAPATVPLMTLRAPVGHTHTCVNGHSWDHSMDGGTHICPFCGESAFIQDRVPKMVQTTVSPQTTATISGSPFSSGGCANGSCGTGTSKTGWYPGKRLGR